MLELEMDFSTAKCTGQVQHCRTIWACVAILASLRMTNVPAISMHTTLLWDGTGNLDAGAALLKS